jgi:tRNA nucleotidyltransferase (CCA-adding enzyme)
MRAEEVIASHGNTDFDAFAAMLAARLLYPGAVVAVGSLNRNVRDFYRLHHDELGAIAETGKLELDAIKRLVVIEATTASRLGELEPVALDPSVGRRCSTTTVRLAFWWVRRAAVFSADVR